MFPVCASPQPADPRPWAHGQEVAPTFWKSRGPHPPRGRMNVAEKRQQPESQAQTSHCRGGARCEGKNPTREELPAKFTEGPSRTAPCFLKVDLAGKVRTPILKVMSLTEPHNFEFDRGNSRDPPFCGAGRRVYLGAVGQRRPCAARQIFPDNQLPEQLPEGRSRFQDLISRREGPDRAKTTPAELLPLSSSRAMSSPPREAFDSDVLGAESFGMGQSSLSPISPKAGEGSLTPIEEDPSRIHSRLRSALHGMDRAMATEFLEDLDSLVEGELTLASEVRRLREGKRAAEREARAAMEMLEAGRKELRSTAEEIQVLTHVHLSHSPSYLGGRVASHAPVPLPHAASEPRTALQELTAERDEALRDAEEARSFRSLQSGAGRPPQPPWRQPRGKS